MDADAALANGLARDLDAAFPLLVADHQDRLYTIALRLLGDRRDAEEVAQDALVRAFRAMRGYPRESEGATAVFFDDLPELKEQPAIIQKSDGGANYTTTDLATINYRIETWKPDEIVYVTDARQQLHFRQLFAIFRRWMPFRFDASTMIFSTSGSGSGVREPFS